MEYKTERVTKKIKSEKVPNNIFPCHENWENIQHSNWISSVGIDKKRHCKETCPTKTSHSKKFYYSLLNAA